MVDPESLRKPRPSKKALHLNVRMVREDAQIFELLCKRTPRITDSQRIRDSARVAAFLIAMRDDGKPIEIHGQDLLEYLGVLR